MFAAEVHANTKSGIAGRRDSKGWEPPNQGDKMQNSNWTLRFPRTSREAFGYSIQPEQHQGNKWAGIAAVFAVGLLIGGWLL